MRFYFLFVSPFLLIVFIYVLLTKDDKKELIKKTLNLMCEKDLATILQYAFNKKMSLALFQLTRIIISLFIAILYGHKLFYSLLIFVIVYKLFYYLAKYFRDNKLKALNDIMPYYMKTIVLLCYHNPVTVAIDKSLNYVDSKLRDRVNELIVNINDNPNSFEPYQIFINSFENRVNNVDYYFRVLYQVNNSSTMQAQKSLRSLNKTISDDLNAVRLKKNKMINDLIGYLGLLPIVLLVIVLTYILIFTISII